MAIFTFSTKSSKPEDTRVVAEAKQICFEEGRNFSALVVELLREWRDKRGQESREV